MQGEATLKQRHAVEKIGVTEGWDNVEEFVAEYGYEWEGLTKQQASDIIEDVMSQKDKAQPKASARKVNTGLPKNQPDGYDDEIPF